MTKVQKEICWYKFAIIVLSAGKPVMQPKTGAEKLWSFYCSPFTLDYSGYHLSELFFCCEIFDFERLVNMFKILKGIYLDILD